MQKKILASFLLAVIVFAYSNVGVSVLSRIDYSRFLAEQEEIKAEAEKDYQGWLTRAEKEFPNLPPEEAVRASKEALAQRKEGRVERKEKREKEAEQNKDLPGREKFSSVIEDPSSQVLKEPAEVLQIVLDGTIAKDSIGRFISVAQADNIKPGDKIKVVEVTTDDSFYVYYGLPL